MFFSVREAVHRRHKLRIERPANRRSFAHVLSSQSSSPDTWMAISFSRRINRSEKETSIDYTVTTSHGIHVSCESLVFSCLLFVDSRASDVSSSAIHSIILSRDTTCCTILHAMPSILSHAGHGFARNFPQSHMRVLDRISGFWDASYFRSDTRFWLTERKKG